MNLDRIIYLLSSFGVDSPFGKFLNNPNYKNHNEKLSLCFHSIAGYFSTG